MAKMTRSNRLEHIQENRIVYAAGVRWGHVLAALSRLLNWRWWAAR
jgi:hypothetical protein